MISTWLGLLVLSFLSLRSVSSIPTTRVPVPRNKTNQELFEEEIVKAKINLQVDLGRSSSASAPTYSNCKVRGVPDRVRNRLRLSRFYKQYAHAYGIPVLASNRVRRGALERACYVMRFLFADRKDIRDWFYRRNGRAGIMAQSEYTTTIPEHSFLPAWWNQRARGLGATIQVPISTGGEENLLCLRGDRYYNEDIFLHEFVHGIHNLGATGAIPDFDRRLRAAYDRARSSGLWRSTYALSTDREYLAEGAQSFFNVNAYSAQPNGVHNHVNTRDKLKRYDPTLFNLVKEIFPCQNTFLKRCDAKNGKQAPPFRMNCKDGGGTVVTDKPPPKPDTPPVPTPPNPNTPPKPDTPPVPTPPNPNTPPKPDTPPVPTPPNPNTPPKPDTPPVPTPPKPNTPPKPDTPPVPTPPKPNTPPKPDTPPVPTPPKPNTPPKPDTPPVPTPPKPNTPPKPDTPPVPTPPKPNTPPKPDTPPVPTPPKPNTPPKPDTPPVPTPPKPNTPPKPDTPPVPTPPKPNTPPKPDTPPVPTPPKSNTPPKPDTPPVPTPPKPNTPPKPDTPPVPTPPKPNTPPKPDTPPVPTPPKPNTPPKPDTPPVPTPPKPNTPPKPDTPPVPTPPKPNTPPKPDTPPVPTPPLPTPPLPTRPKPTRKKTFRCRFSQYRYRDFNYFCGSWARKGECARNPNYMLVYCCRSCGSTPVTLVPKPRNCRDANVYCSSWARRGECRSNPNYMNQYCKSSCNRC